jgi:sterol 3beta-glucosyltransferase
MKVLIYAWGSRGDVQPYLALAYALTQAGHQATLAAPVPHEALAAEYGVGFFPRDDTNLKLLEKPEVRELLYAEGSRYLGLQSREEAKEFKAKAKKLMAEVMPLQKQLLEPMLNEQLEAAVATEPDVIVQTHDNMDYGHFVAEKLGTPRVVAELYPFHLPSWHYPSMPFQDKKLARPLNRLSHVPTNRLLPLKKRVERWRSEVLGLPTRRGRHNRMRTADGHDVPMLHMFSRHLFPPAPDWPSTVYNMGFSFLPTLKDYTPPESLARFLAAGPPPIAIGFGSLSNPDPLRTGAMVVDAVRAAGVRAVVIRGGGKGIDIAEPGEDIVMVDSVPFDWLHSRVCGMVQGGGIGVTHDGLAGGIPTLACPLFKEAAMWGGKVHENGAGLEPIWQAYLDTPKLTEALRKLATDEDLAAGARRMRDLVRAEPGHPMAIEVIERAAAGVPTPAPNPS